MARSLSGARRRQALVLGLLYIALLAETYAFSFTSPQASVLQVAGSYWASGDAALKGLNPYLAYPLTWITGLKVVDVNLNPPILLPVFELLAMLPPVTAAKLWVCANALLFGATATVLVRRKGYAVQPMQFAWIFWAPAISNSLQLGQLYALIFALAVGGWFLLEDGRDMLAGLCIGALIAIKPNFAMWALFLFVSGCWRSAIVAGVTAGALTLLSAAIYGVTVFRQWMDALALDKHYLIMTDVSIHGYLARLGVGGAATPLTLLIVLSMLLLVWRQRSSLGASRLGIVMSLLASPLAWFHYALALFPALVERPWTKRLKVAAGLLSVPVIVPVLTFRGPHWLLLSLGSLYFFAIVIIAAEFAGIAFRERFANSGSPVINIATD